MSTLKTIWTSQRWPTLNGVILNNGLYYPIVPIDPPRALLPLRLQHQIPKLITDLNPQQTTLLIAASETTTSTLDYKALAGACSLGEEGFVALMTSNHELCWGAYFDFSNPFEHVWFEGTDVIAKNNLGEEWQLPMHRPWEVTVTPTALRSSSRF